MAKLIKFELTKSYATFDNAVKAVAKYGITDEADGLNYFIHRDEATGRYFPVFVGERAIQRGIHFRFHIVG